MFLPGSLPVLLGVNPHSDSPAASSTLAGGSRRIAPGNRIGQRVAGEVLGGGRDGCRVLRAGRQVGAGVEDQRVPVPAEAAADRGAVAGTAHGESALGAG